MLYQLSLRRLAVTCFTLSINFLSACSFTNLNQIKPLSEFDNSSEFKEEEKELFKKSSNLRKDFKRKGLIYSDKQVNNYIKKIANRIKPEYLHSRQINFYIIKDPTPNAFALPNGDIYLNTGLLSVLENEDQLASVMSHEIAHVVLRHSLKSKIKRSETIISARVSSVFLLGFSYLAAASNLSSFSQEQEQEADIHGLSTLYASGYQPSQAAASIEKFNSLPGANSNSGTIFSTHPENTTRIEYLKLSLKDQYKPNNIKITDTGEYNTIRRKTLIANIETSLSKSRFLQASYLINLASELMVAPTMVEYFKAETYRLKSLHPMRAIQDEASVTNRSSGSNKLITKHKAEAKSNLSSARKHYLTALKHAPDNALAYRGLGLLSLFEKNNNAALFNLNKYLKLASKPKDRIYITNIISKLK